MGRSKFPGKPSKHVNRKRVNVLPPTPDTTTTECSRSMTVETLSENKQARDEPDSAGDIANASNSINNTKVSLRRRLTRKLQNSKALLATNNNNKRSLLSKLCTKSGVKSKTARQGSISRKYSTMRNRTNPQDSTNHVGKFVLPTRSVHSSRVIKPNKRFINVDLSDTLTLKKKVNKRHCLNVVTDQDQSSISCESSDVNSASPTFSNGRVVLRQARLKLHNQTPSGTEGPFSSSSTNGSPPGTVTCGVCGAVRFYRFVKQARKFNIYSCESCRKFISKMIKRQSCGKNLANSTLVCHKGQGVCHVPPIVRSQQMKLIRCAYKARCPACWLKMCLRSFQMPMSLKHSLVQLLPKNMQGSDVIFSNSLPLLWQAKVQNIESKICESLESKSETLVKQRPVRFKGSTNVKTNPVTVAATTDIKRQKVDLKGPRVKHVCRSASIVLGQPLATFPIEQDFKKKPEVIKETAIEVVKKLDEPKIVTLLPETTVKETKTSVKSVDFSFSETESSDSDKLSKLPLIVNDTLISNIKRDRRIPFSSSSESKSGDKKRNSLDLQNTLSIDHWDVDDVNKNGFCLIASQQFPMAAICFLCGSAGQEALLHCSLCCEPYHPFCLEQSPPVNNNNNRQSVWLCPRCTTCTACNESDRQKVNCHKCSKTYHPECLNARDPQDRPIVCSKCLTCKSCGDGNTTKFVGNLPLCEVCFKLKKKGNSCPMCEGSYNDSNFNEKVMECTRCDKWIHAKCEGLSEESYHILSILPESVKYLCSLCSKESPPSWRKAVQSELKFNFNQVLRLLSKNKIARNVLKLSPLNNHSAVNNKTITTVRKLQFSDEDDDENSSLSFEDCNKNDKIFTNRIELEESKVMTMFDIKKRLNSNEYISIGDFNKEMEEALSNTHSEELLIIYRSILQSIFPWFEKPQNLQSINQDSTLKNDCINNTSYGNDESYVEIESNKGMDSRYCSFCKKSGDCLNHLESRLLYCGLNEWVHINCALWSSEVYEEIDGSLQNVHSALSRGRLIRCSYCKQKGATVGCCFKNCYETFHFICARNAKCHFMYDRTIYCFTHEPPKGGNLIISSPADFDVRRSVFIEISDSKKGRYSQIDKVNVMIGSLSVSNLGKVNPALSDNLDAIIPTGYVCSRLFWSTIEPWKLVSYKITTSILNAHVNTLFVDKNFTVDHSMSKPLVDRKLKEIIMWHKDNEKNKSDLVEFDDEEEPQNGADLLSPEITDAIFEELPHELLDGISVQDIFPKLMAYEDFINIDYKSETNTSDFAGNDLKKTEGDLVETLSEFDDSTGNGTKTTKPRSCSLTLSCKLDNAFSPVVKKRKMAPPRDNMFFQLLQVDGNFDDSSSSECESPVGTISADSSIWNSNCEEPVTCERCHCTYRTKASYSRHLESCEMICSSESDSEINQDQEIGEATETTETQSVVLASFETYQNEIHTSVMNTQTYVKSTEMITVPHHQSTSEVVIDQKSLNLPVGTVAPLPADNDFVPMTSNNQFCINQTVPICVNQPLSIQPVSSGSIINSNNQIINQTISINQNGSISLNQPVEFHHHHHHQPSVTIQPVQYQNNVAPIINVTAPQNQLITSNHQNLINVNMPTNRWVKQPNKPFNNPKSAKIRRGRSIAAKRSQFEDNEAAIIIPQSGPQGPSVIVQHLPSTSYIPTFVDTFHQQQAGQNLQYVATLAPQQINSQPIVQIQDNMISLLQPQPTMIIQQPRMIENQLVLDGNGSFTWAPQQLQPIYYGFETIVQNTVMQSQQLLPTTVPGVLTANSSYSTTTQVFQTSKLEPVLDVGGNSFVLLNPGIVNSQGIDVQQPQQAQPIITRPHHVQQPVHDVVKTPKFAITSVSAPVMQAPAPPAPSTVPCVTTVTTSPSCITLPTAPFVSEQRIPTNIVTPTPKAPTSIQSRPMSRVLPMQTVKEPVRVIKEKPIVPDIVKDLSKAESTVDFQKLTPQLISVETRKRPIELQLVNDLEIDSKAADDLKSLLLFQTKPSQEVFTLDKPIIISDEKINQLRVPQEQYKTNFSHNKVQVAPLKPIKGTPVPVFPLTESKTINKSVEKIPERVNKFEKKEVENVPAILYTIETQDGFKYSSTSISDLWAKVFEAVQNARIANNMPPLPPDSTNIMNSLQILGLKSSGLKYLIEQLPGASKCAKYKPSFNFASKLIEIEDEPVGHTSGSARCAPNIKRNEPYDMFGWLASKHRKPEHSIITSELIPRRGSVNNMPMAMRFRQLKLTSRYSVGVYRSRIHRRGLFCLRDFEAGEMVIEYSGEVIRSILTDKREKYYNSKAIGCYMFRIDDNLVVDATMTGNSARFINHSCDPNCYSKVVEILGHKHIIIFALRRIICGEELTYDYKFPIEEDKIPCTCGMRRCRKFLN